MRKTKTFICTIPFQEEGKLNPVLYPAHGNKRLEYGKLIQFPIIPVINGYAEKIDKIRIIAILTDGPNFMHNYEKYFKPTITEFVAEKGYDFEGIELINSEDSEDIETHLKLFADIIAKINDNEELYACITFGTKPTPIVQQMALNYAYKLKSNISIGCMAYGRYTFNDTSGQNGIYDQTALFFMNSIVQRLADTKAKNPEKAIRAMLGLGDDNE